MQASADRADTAARDADPTTLATSNEQPASDASAAPRCVLAPASASSFRKFRNLLMAKQFESRDNTPVCC